MKIIRDIKYKWSWLSILNSPFKIPSVWFYFGKIEIGTPYFLPRKWVRLTWDEAKDKVVDNIIKNVDAYKKAGKSFKIPTRKEIRSNIKEKQRTKKAIPLKFGIQVIPLGWKTKFDQYRHEWNPMISIVAFNRQFCVFFGLRETMSNMCYWEAWLYYRHETDKKQTKEQRLAQCREKYTASWGTSKKGYTDYYELIVRKKYL